MGEIEHFRNDGPWPDDPEPPWGGVALQTLAQLYPGERPMTDKQKTPAIV